MKKQFLLLLSVLLTSLSASAFEVDGIYYDILPGNDLTCAVASSPSDNKYSGDVVIPSTVSYDEETETSGGFFAAKNRAGIFGRFFRREKSELLNMLIAYR